MRISKEHLNEIDKQIRELILLLNKKGYDTIDSCSGHTAKSQKTFDELPLEFQERIMNFHKQFGDKKSFFYGYTCDGYIGFRKKEDAKKVYDLIQKTSVKNKFIFRKKGMERNIIVLYMKKGCSQKNRDNIWKKVTKELTHPRSFAFGSAAPLSRARSKN